MLRGRPVALGGAPDAGPCELYPRGHLSGGQAGRWWCDQAEYGAVGALTMPRRDFPGPELAYAQGQGLVGAYFGCVAAFASPD